MTNRFRLDAVLRARQAQEDVAKGGVARARRDADAAAEHAGERGALLRSRGVPRDGTARAVVAALAARQSLAAALAAAEDTAEKADRRAAEGVDQLTRASTRRRSVERLMEQHEAARRQAELGAEQRDTDELATTEQQRVAAREVRE
jgi:flagellar protein FliJ